MHYKNLLPVIERPEQSRRLWRSSMMCLWLLLFACSGSSSNNVSSAFPNNFGEQGGLSLQLVSNQEFNPFAEPGKLAEFVVTITASGQSEPIQKNFPADSESATFDSFPAGTTLTVQIDAINSNGQCVRRGRSSEVTIVAGQNTTATLGINNVPIFTNITDGSEVVAERFSPKIFAPGEIRFALNDVNDGITSSLSSPVTGDTAFSISADESETSTMSVPIPILAAGEHQLTVSDVDTGESSTVTIHVLSGGPTRALTTTAGGWLGLPIHVTGTKHTGWFDVVKRILE